MGGSVGRRFAANNIVSLDYSSDSDRVTLIIFLLIDSNDPSMGPNEDFRSAGNFCRQCECEINFSAGSEILFHYEVNATSGDIPGLTVVLRRLPIDGKANTYRQGQVVPSCHPAFSHPRCSAKSIL